MKNKFNLTTFSLLTILFISSCTSSDDGAIDNNVIIKQITDYAIDGSWRITNYEDSGQNETSDYNGYTFVFNSDGSVSASNGTNTYSGSWSVTDDSKSDDDNDNDLDFNILFLSPPDFEELSDDWDIVSSSNTKIDLIDISGGNGGTDRLTFEKN